MRVLLIIPAYNEEKNILNTVAQIKNAAFKDSADFDLDFVVINDGSSDMTEKLCRSNGVKCITLVQNLGIGGAVQTGYMYADSEGYDIAVQFDGDGQHDINSLPDILAPILEGKCNFCVGSRFVDGTSSFQSTFMRRVGIKYLSFIIRLVTGQKISDVTSGYRAADRATIKFLAHNYPIDYPEPESLVSLHKKKTRICEVQANMFERGGGKSSINFVKSIYYMIKVTLAILCTAMQKGGDGK